MSLKPMCKYGASCYRKNADHLAEYAHPDSKRAKNAPPTVTLVNDSDVAVGGANAPVSILFRTQAHVASGSVCTTSLSVMLPPRARAQAELVAELSGEPVVEWSLGLRVKGLLWRDGPREPGPWGEIAMPIVPGGVYTIIADASNAPLSDAEGVMVAQAIYDAIESGVPFAQIWEHVTRALPHVARGRTPAQLKAVHDFDSNACGSWTNWYRPRLPDPAVATLARLRQAVVSGRFHIQLYWRALDRFPGGNANMHTIRYTLRSEGSAGARVYSNWDGGHARSAFVPPSLNEKLPSALPMLTQHVLDCAECTAINSECTVKDMIAIDSDEDDTEWTSMEVLLLVPLEWSPATHVLFPYDTRLQIRTLLLVNQRAATKLSRDVLHLVFRALAMNCDSPPWTPLFRLHWRSVPGMEGYGWRKAKLEPHIEPTASQHALLNAVHELVGMGRVNEFIDAGDDMEPCDAARDRDAGTGQVDRFPPVDNYYKSGAELPHLQPAYLRYDD